MTRRKEKKYLQIGLQDGFSGTADIDDASIAANDTTLLVDSASLDLHDDVTVVPVGARFTTAGISTIRTVTAQNNSAVWTLTITATGGTYTLTFQGQTTSALAFDAVAATVQTALEALSNVAVGELLVSGTGPLTITAAGTHANTASLVLTVGVGSLTGGSAAVAVVEDGTETWQLTFTPAIATGSVPVTADVITFLPQRVTMKLGTGNIDYTENDDPIFDTDRDVLDGVRSGTEVPMDVNMSFVFDWLRSSSGQPITVYEALRRIGNASGWHNAADDPCEPYCVDIFLVDTPPCGSEETEVYILPKFYPTSVNPDVEAALVTLVGKCNATRATITREPVVA